MRSVWAVITFIWTVVIAGIVVNLISSRADIFVAKGAGRAYLPVSAGVLALLLVFTALVWGLQRTRTSRGQFALFKKTSDLVPQDLGFVEVVASGNGIEKGHRPYVEGIYIKRNAVPYQERHSESPTRVFAESDVAAILAVGGRVLLVGQPTEGKTRTLFETAKTLSDFIVICPHHDRNPSEESVGILKGRNVLLLLDDLNQFDGAPVNVALLCDRLSRTAARLSIAATCREGPALTKLQFTTGSLQRVYESFEHILFLVRTDLKQQEVLKRAFGETTSTVYPTLGSICMRDALQRMRGRFRALELSTQECFNAIQLVAAAGLSCSQERVRATLSAVFSHNIELGRLRQLISELSQHGFVRSSPEADPILPEDAFIADAETPFYYREGRQPSDDFSLLATCLSQLRDADGLNRVAITSYQMGERERALGTWQLLLASVASVPDAQVQHQVAQALVNQGVVLGEERRLKEELSSYNEVLKQFGHSNDSAFREPLARALLYKGAVLEQLHETQAASEAYESLVTRFGDAPESSVKELIAEALLKDGDIQSRRGRVEKAVSLYDDLVRRFGDALTVGLQQAVARGLLKKGDLIVSHQGGIWPFGSDESPYQQLLRRYSAISELRVYVAQALLSQARILAKRGDPRAWDLGDEILRRFGHATEPELSDVCHALNKMRSALGFKPRVQGSTNPTP